MYYVYESMCVKRTQGSTKTRTAEQFSLMSIIARSTKAAIYIYTFSAPTYLATSPVAIIYCFLSAVLLLLVHHM